MKEKISALLDGELEGSEQDDVLRQISRDPELSGVWSRYHLYRAVFREEEAVNHNPHLTNRIIDCLSEATVEHEDNVYALNKVAGAKWSRWRPGLAIAASLIVATALAVFVRDLADVGKATSTLALNDKTTWEMNLDNEDTLNRFLVEHGEFTPPSGMNGLIAYAKFVSYDSQR